MPPLAITIDAEFPDQPALDPLGSLEAQLDLLARRSVKATFFIVGAWAQAHPELVGAIRDAGHQIGNHSHSHCILSRLSEAGIVEDLTACHDALAELGVETRPWFRAPQGVITHPHLDVAAAIKQAGYRHVHWHAHGEDWRPGISGEAIAESALADVRQRWPRPAIVLLHSWPDATPRALEIMLDALESDGAAFATVEQLGWRQAVAGRLHEATTRRGRI